MQSFGKMAAYACASFGRRIDHLLGQWCNGSTPVGEERFDSAQTTQLVSSSGVLMGSTSVLPDRGPGFKSRRYSILPISSNWLRRDPDTIENAVQIRVWVLQQRCVRP